MEALAGGRRRRSLREEELLGLLAGFPEDGDCGSDRELSFSDLVEAGGATTRPSADDGAPAPREEDPAPAQHEAAASREQRQQQQAAARERRQRRQRSGAGSRGSCGGGGDGVLLNFYVPGLLTRSMTAPRPGRGVAQPPPAAVQGAPAKAAVAATATGKGRTQGPLGIGCWPALWGRGRGDRRRPAKACT